MSGTWVPRSTPHLGEARLRAASPERAVAGPIGLAIILLGVEVALFAAGRWLAWVDERGAAAAAGEPGGPDGRAGLVAAWPEGRADGVAIVRVAGLGSPWYPVPELGRARLAQAGRALRGTVELVGPGAEGEADVLWLPADDVIHLASRGRLRDLRGCVAREGIDAGGFAPAALRSIPPGPDGSLAALPDLWDPWVLAADPVALGRAGVRSIDTGAPGQLAEAAAALSQWRPGAPRRVGVDPGLPRLLPVWAMTGGARLVGDDPWLGLADRRAAAGLAVAAGLYGPAGGASAAWRLLGADEVDRLPGDALAAGRAAVEPVRASDLDRLAARGAGPFRVDPFRDRDGIVVGLADVHALAIPSGAPDPSAACRVLAALVRPETWTAARRDLAAERAAAGRDVVAVPSSLAGDEIAGPGDRVVARVARAAVAIPATTRAAELRTAWEEAVVRVLVGGDSPLAALTQGLRAAMPASYAQP